MSYLKAIPDNFAELLENAESFEVWVFNPNLRNKRFGFKSEYIEFQANQINKNIDDAIKKNLVSAILRDIKKGGQIARCWIPHHGIRAIYDNQIIELAFCYMCHSFRGQIADKKIYGSIPQEKNCKSKNIFEEIIANGLNYSNL
ncbi:MAG TPA: hypothetical protein PKE69_04830 [Pyrinomonadaceae bacterium]|nr:hypothetical protein [Pyrinomonadaceae bacterium]